MNPCSAVHTIVTITTKKMSAEQNEEGRRRRRLYAIALVVALPCYGSALCLIIIAVVLFCPNCPWPNSQLAWTEIGISILLFVIGGTILICGVTFFKRKQSNVSLRDVVFVSRVQAENSQLMSLPNLPFNYIPVHGESNVEAYTVRSGLPDYFATVQNNESYLGDPPDYLSAMQNQGEIYIQFSGDVHCTGEDVSETPPPRYEIAITETQTCAAIETSNGKQT